MWMVRIVLSPLMHPIRVYSTPIRFQFWHMNLWRLNNRRSHRTHRLAPAFFDHWVPFWLRDGDADLCDITQRQSFLDMTANVKPLTCQGLHRDFSYDEWNLAVSRTKVDSARGSRGMSQPELKSMSRKLVDVLLMVCNRFPLDGFPNWLMLARVVLLLKERDAATFAKMRPTTTWDPSGVNESCWVVKQI